MTSNRIMRGGAVRRGGANVRQGRTKAPFLVLTLALALLVGCGEGGDIATAVPDKEGDAKMLNELLGRQLSVVAAYDRSMPALSGPQLALARQFRAQEQEHVDTVVKALRGIGAKYEPTEEEIDVTELRGEAEHLELFYIAESATIDLELKMTAALTASFVRPPLAAMVANQAQRLVLLRRALGAKGPELVPDAFEAGTTPAPTPPPAGKE